jgi:hypothetical protein
MCVLRLLFGFLTAGSVLTSKPLHFVNTLTAVTKNERTAAFGNQLSLDRRTRQKSQKA